MPCPGWTNFINIIAIINRNLSLFIQVYWPWEQKAHCARKHNRDLPPGETFQDIRRNISWALLILADSPCLVLREWGLKSVRCSLAPCSHPGAGQPLTLPGGVSPPNSYHPYNILTSHPILYRPSRSNPTIPKIILLCQSSSLLYSYYVNDWGYPVQVKLLVRHLCTTFSLPGSFLYQSQIKRLDCLWIFLLCFWRPFSTVL